jgi:hypothetical protein
MKDSSKKLFEKFIQNANWKMIGLSPDMERFWDFVISAYRNDEHDISQDEFLDVISASVKPATSTNLANQKTELASKMVMFNKYEDGIKLLGKFEGK